MFKIIQISAYACHTNKRLILKSGKTAVCKTVKVLFFKLVKIDSNRVEGFGFLLIIDQNWREWMWSAFCSLYCKCRSCHEMRCAKKHEESVMHWLRSLKERCAYFLFKYEKRILDLQLSDHWFDKVWAINQLQRFWRVQLWQEVWI